MPFNSTPTAAQIIAISDGLASIFQISQPSMGLGIVGETGTAAAAVNNLRVAITGDGTSGNPGIGSVMESPLSAACDAFLQRERWDCIFQQARNFITILEAQIQSNLPLGWVMTSGTNPHFLDNLLLRINANHVGTPATPASPGVLTAVNSTNGALPTSTLGNCPWVVHTLVAGADWNESQPSGTATQVAITSPNDSLSYQIAGTVPSLVTAVRTYRSLFGGAAGPFYLDQTTPVVAGSAFPAILITAPDSVLILDTSPPIFCGCLVKPEFAMIVALAYATSINGIQAGVPLSLTAANMMSPSNVALNASSAFNGLGNQPSSTIFATKVAAGALTVGTIQATNYAPYDIQGFAGSLSKLQARVTSPISVAGTTTVTYTYLAASTGLTPQSATSAAATFLGTANNSTATYVIPAGRLITAVSALSETPVSGTYIVESLPIRP